MTDDQLTKAIIGCAYKVHNALGPGFLEKVYENAMRIELEKLGFRVKQQEPVNVIYDGHFVGQYYADLFHSIHLRHDDGRPKKRAPAWLMLRMNPSMSRV